MAKPRVFVSSTYYDLKSVRADIDHFVRDLGFDPVLHERGNVPYGKKEALERYCYKEIESCDILISLVGGKFGSTSEDEIYSVSQMELKVALDQAKQVYIFVEREVYHEYRTYELNKDAKIDWASVNNVKIFHFLDELYKLKNNNPIMPFETSQHIVENLREQWAGLFQRLLGQAATDTQANMFLELRHSLETARSLVDVISSRSDAKDEMVADLILTNHPLFAAVRKAVNVGYRLLFYDLDELTKWIEARSYVREDDDFDDDNYQWIKRDSNTGRTYILKIKKDLFDDSGKLKAISAAGWSEEFVSHTVIRPRKAVLSKTIDDDDDIPF